MRNENSAAANIPLVAPVSITWADNAKTVTIDGVEWRYNISSDKSVCAIGVKNPEGDLPSQVTIPSELEGVKVTAVAADAFSHNEDIESVVIPDSVTVIADGAFFLKD